jgi:hypothetical protein
MNAGIGISTHIDWGAPSVDRVESEDCEDGIENNLGNLSISKVRKRFGIQCTITKTNRPTTPENETDVQHSHEATRDHEQATCHGRRALSRTLKKPDAKP